jgi:hypothetical protein
MKIIKIIKMKKYKNFLIVLVCFISLQACFNTNTTQCIKGDCYNGPGMINYQNGDFFDGTFLDGQIDKGTYIFNNGTKYIGTWNNGQLNGVCEFFFNDGTIYIGEVRDGQFHGLGTSTMADGSKWTGTWNNGERAEGNFNYENVYNPEDIVCSDSIQILELIKGDANMHLIDVDFNGVKEKFIFDTGASNIFMTPSLLNKIKLSGAKVESLNIIDSKAEIANGDLIPIEYVRISNVKIGNFILNNLIVSVSYDDKSSLLFGKGVLNKFKNYSFSKDGSLTLVK